MSLVARVDAPAKVNPTLRIGGADPPSGYHRVETALLAVGLFDSLRVSLRDEPGIQLELDGPPPCPPEENLAVRAAAAFLRGDPAPPGVLIELEKRIPAGAGLGGGSSDAGAVLRALMELLPGRHRGSALPAIAAELGADVPFFATGVPFALAGGAGEILTPIQPPPMRHLVIAAPAQGISTAWAYRALDLARAGSEAPLPERESDPRRWQDWSWIAQTAENDFSPVLDRELPELEEIRRTLLGAGASLALLSGSGSATFGVFASEAEAGRGAAEVRSSGAAAFVAVAPTLGSCPPVQVVP